MWDINLKATNEQDKQTNSGTWTSGYQRVGGRREGGGRWVKGGQICGDRKKSNYGR